MFVFVWFVFGRPSVRLAFQTVFILEFSSYPVEVLKQSGVHLEIRSTTMATESQTSFRSGRRRQDEVSTTSSLPTIRVSNVTQHARHQFLVVSKHSTYLHAVCANQRDTATNSSFSFQKVMNSDNLGNASSQPKTAGRLQRKSILLLLVFELDQTCVRVEISHRPLPVCYNSWNRQQKLLWMVEIGLQRVAC